MLYHWLFALPRLLIRFIALIYLLVTFSSADSQMRRSDCSHSQAEDCFNSLFDNMPICEEHDDVIFRCHHYKVLDVCFNKNKMKCSRMSLGRIAKNAYRKKIVECAKQSKKQYRDAPTRKKQPPKIIRLHTPSELQFVSLFGYLEIQCNTNSMGNCTNENFKEMLSNCEMAILQRSNLITSDLDRHQLLKIKLDASSRLLQYSETNQKIECLMVRSALSDIYQLHQKYCFETYVTRCLCERLNFSFSCDIDCEQLEASDLPFDQHVSWDDFKGRLIGASTNCLSINFILIFVCMFNRKLL